MATKLNRVEERMVENFNRRYHEHWGKGINNSDLPAGAPMYYYCKACGIHIATMPEDHLTPVPHYCDDCIELRKLALLDEAIVRTREAK